MTGGEFRPSNYDYAPVQRADQLGAFLRKPELSDELTRQLASYMQEDLNVWLEVKQPPEPIPLEEETFRSLFDPEQPVIVVDAENIFPGAELLGVAATEPNTRANIVFVSSCANNITVAPEQGDQKAALIVESGVMILPDGQVAYGRFPEPIQADMFETGSITVIKQCEAAGITTSLSVATAEATGDKRRLTDLLRGASVGLPERIPADEFLESKSTDNLVIKPSQHSLGTGVLITGSDSNPERVKQTYDFLYTKGYKPIVEKRIKSWPFRDPQTDERLDWNVRALVGYGKLLGMYIRADTWGKPVNRSLNAAAIRIEEMGNYLDDPAMQSLITRKLEEAAIDVAQELPDGTFGLDLVVDESLEAQLFEVNNNRAGGVQTIAEISTDIDTKLAIPREILELMRTRALSLRQPKSTVMPTIPIEPPFFIAVACADNLGYGPYIADLDPNTIPDEVDDNYEGRIRWLLIRQRAYRASLRDSLEVEENLFNVFPLELPRYLPKLIAGGAQQYSEYEARLAEAEQLFPGNKEWPTLQCAIAAKRYDLATYRQALRSALERGAQFEDIQGANIDALLTPFSETIRRLDEQARKPFAGMILDAMTVYCMADYEKALEFIDLQDSSYLGEDDTPVTGLRAILAIGSRHYDDAVNAYLTLDDSEIGQIIDFVNEPRHDSLKEDVEGLLFCAKLLRAQNLTLNPILESIIFAQNKPQADPGIQKLFFELSQLLPFEGSQTDRRDFAAALSSLANVEQPPSPGDYQSLSAASSDIKKFSFLVRSCFTGKLLGDIEMWDRFFDSGILGTDLGFYRDLLEEGPLTSSPHGAGFRW